jgi:hypothetical protein
VAEAGENGGAPDTGAGEGAPAEAQGGDLGALYGKYVSAAPPEIQDTLTQALHQFNSETVAPKLREAAEFRKQYEPLAGIEGLTDLDPESLSQLVNFGKNIASDPESFSQWYSEVADDMAAQDPEGFEALWQEIGERRGYFEDPEGGDGEGSDPQVQALEQQIHQLSETLNGFLGQQEQSQKQTAANEAIDAEMTDLVAKHNDGEPFDEKLAMTLYRLAAGYPDSEEQPLHKAFEEVQALRGGAQSELVQSKLDQPAGANSGGRPDTAPEEYHSLEDAKEAALARIKQATAA